MEPSDKGYDKVLEAVHRYFPALGEKNFDQLASYLTLRHFNPGSVVFREGDDSNALCFVLNGEVTILKEESKNLETGSDLERQVLLRVKPGEMFGEIAFLDELPRSATAVTNHPTSLALLSRESFTQMKKEAPHLCADVLHALSQVVCARLRVAGRTFVDLQLNVDSAIRQLSL